MVRYNHVYTDADHRFNDIFGAGSNFSTKGFPNRDSDIYGNHISGAWDDGIESEGANQNVRIWGNWIEDTLVKIATASTSIGPLYVWRNVGASSRETEDPRSDAWGRGGFLKTSDRSPAGGRIFVFHNTVLQPAPSAGQVDPLGSSPGLGHTGRMKNTTSRNNVLHVYRSTAPSINDRKKRAGGDYDYDLYNGAIVAKTGSEAHGIRGVPTYDPASSPSCGPGPCIFWLEFGSLGYDAGEILPNFNDGHTQGGPDLGAHEAGTAAMEFGVDAYRSSPP